MNEWLSHAFGVSDVARLGFKAVLYMMRLSTALVLIADYHQHRAAASCKNRNKGTRSIDGTLIALAHRFGRSHSLCH